MTRVSILFDFDSGNHELTSKKTNMNYRALLLNPGLQGKMIFSNENE